MSHRHDQTFCLMGRPPSRCEQAQLAISLQNLLIEWWTSASFQAAVRVSVSLGSGFCRMDGSPGGWCTCTASCVHKRLKSKDNLGIVGVLRSLFFFSLQIGWSVNMVIVNHKVIMNLATLLHVYVGLGQQKLTVSWWYKAEETRTYF